MRIRYLLLAIVFFAIGFSATADWDQRSHLQYDRTDLKWNRKYLSEIAKLLHDYDKSHGHYPTNDQGLRVLKIDKDNLNYLYRLSRFVTVRGDILSVWGEPVVYENRRGLPAEKFRDSGATLDAKRVYSVKVDDGIYIWSLGAPRAIAIHRRNFAVLVLLYVLFYVGSLVFLALWIWSGRNPSRRAIHNVGNGIFYAFTGGFLTLIAGGFLAFLISPLTGGALGTTCYECYFPATPDRRSRQSANDYIELTRKFRDRGIITEKTYQKVLDSAKKDQYEK